MENKNQKKSFLKRLFSKKAAASVGTAVKVLTSVVLGAAMLVGTYGVVKTGVIPTTEAKVSSMYEVTDAIELNGGGAGGGVVVPDPVVELKRNGIIPEGATYTPNGGTAIIGNGTNTFPEAPADGDEYTEGDYTYKYNYYYNHSSWRSNTSQNGWGVRVKDTSKNTYGDILSEIAGQPVNTMSYTFKGCTSLTTAPEIPSSVTNMYFTFDNCTSLTTAPTIPSSVTMQGTFRGCISLITAPEMPSSIKSVWSTFEGCRSLTTAPTIPSGVTDMDSTFKGCTSLTTAPEIPSSVTNMNNAFFGCTSLTAAPTIPNSVTSMETTFKNCTSITTAPSIPNSVTSMFGTFIGCTSLKTYVGSADVDGDFSNYTIPNSVTNMYNTFSGCTSLTTAPAIPNSVTDMSGTFNSCTSLTGTMEVNANPTSYKRCLKSTQITGITGSCSQETKNALMATK